MTKLRLVPYLELKKVVEKPAFAGFVGKEVTILFEMKKAILL
jgi:hypothetical protein